MSRITLALLSLILFAGCTVNISTPPVAAPTPTVTVVKVSTPAQPSSESPVRPAPGTYQGLAVQDSKSSKVWTVRIQFAQGRGLVEYTLRNSAKSCAGTITKQPDGRWLERITQGTCDDGGSWTFQQSEPSSVHGEYQPPSGSSYSVTAELARQ
jgi:hypothetical protein